MSQITNSPGYDEATPEQLSDRDAALARCVEALAYYANSRDIYSGEDLWLYAEQTLASLPTSAQAAAKVLAAARAYYEASVHQANTEIGHPMLADRRVRLLETLDDLFNALREEKES